MEQCKRLQLKKFVRLCSMVLSDIRRENIFYLMEHCLTKFLSRTIKIGIFHKTIRSNLGIESKIKVLSQLNIEDITEN